MKGQSFKQTQIAPSRQTTRACRAGDRNRSRGPRIDGQISQCVFCNLICCDHNAAVRARDNWIINRVQAQLNVIPARTRDRERERERDEEEKKVSEKARKRKRKGGREKE